VLGQRRRGVPKDDRVQVIAEHKSQGFVFALAGFVHHTELTTCDPPRLIFY
jgi:hypothetical protein